jgi:ABC-type multidrug transport system fused ATPase/permease subunit
VTGLRPAVAGKTVLIAAQRLSTIQIADRAVVLDGGVVVEDGAPAALLGRGALFTSLFGDEIVAA